MFFNYVNGYLTVNTYRNVTAQTSYLQDIAVAIEYDTGESLTCELDLALAELANTDWDKLGISQPTLDLLTNLAAPYLARLF